MPDAAPRDLIDTWLGHLDRDRRGLPIPYINARGPETIERMYVTHDPWVRMPGVYEREDLGLDVDFTRQDMARQREVMIRGLCQVCARPIPWRRRLLVLSSLSVTFIDIEALNLRGVPVVSEPWLDARCARIATTWCPALIRRSHGDDLTVHAIDSPADVHPIVSTGTLDGPLAAATRARPPALWVKLAVLNRLILPAEATGTAAAAG